MNYKSSAELKGLAREQLKGKYGVPIGAIVITMLLSITLSLLSTFFYKTESVSAITIYYLISFIISLLSAVLSIGLIKFFTNFCRNQKYQISNIFWGFMNHPDKVIISTILLTLIMIVFLLPGILLFVLYVMMQEVMLFVIALLVTIVGVVFMMIISLAYSQVYYIIADETCESAIEALKLSRKMMKGNKGRLFYLQISFIGWYLLSILSCFIALLWIEPYVICTTTYFYLDLKGEFRETVIDAYV
ncbi:MAG: DUF975 family protein [Lachnotalea sp.]